jgi:serine/threonine protein kinase
METDIRFDRAALIGRGRTAEVYAWENAAVLKLFLAGFPTSLSQQEIQGLRAANKAGIPSPRFLEAVTLDGRCGIVMERVTGQTMQQLLAARPYLVTHHARLFAELQAQMHSCHAPEILSRKESLGAQIVRAGVTSRIKSIALARLDVLPDGDTICHGDLHPDNVLMTARGPVIIDWSFSTSGNPASDAARTALMLRISNSPGTAFQNNWADHEARSLFHRVWFHRYRELQPSAAKSMRDWLLPVAIARLADGLPDEHDMLASLIERLAARH